MMIASASLQDMALEAKITKEKCGICCTPISARGVLDCCSDIFCFSCIDTWSAFTNLCPLCKMRFKFITFVPAVDDRDTSEAETQETFFDFLGQERVENWIDEDEADGTLSFPSYFIDEDAVVCLDGDGCQVRKGLSEKDGELGLEDISVACDSCDCWYHASCVGYNPDSQEQRSWICPRCVGTGVLDLFKFQQASKNFTSKLSNKSLSPDKDGIFTYVDEGETAVVVSMDANFGAMLNQAIDRDRVVGITSLVSEHSLDECCPQAVADLGKIPAGLTMGSTENLSQETSDISKGPTQQDENALEEASIQKCSASDDPLDCANAMQEPSETCSKKPTIETEFSSTFSPSNPPNQMVLEVNSVPPFQLTQEDQNLTNTAVGIAEPPGEVLKAVSNQNAVDVGKVLKSMDIEPRKSDTAEEAESVKQGPVPLGRQNKTLKIQESLHNLSEKQQRHKQKVKMDDSGSLSINSSNFHTMDLEEASHDHRPIELAQRRKQVKPLIEEKAITLSKNKSDSKVCITPDAKNMEQVFKPESEPMDELREVVEGPTLCHRRLVVPQTKANNMMNESSDGVRTRKIVYRGNPLDENLSRIVNEMRLYLKQEAVALGTVGSDRKLDVMDEKFFVAFKAAVQKSPTCLRLLHSGPARRISLQKPGAKLDGSRRSLMKKLYGGSGKRRQAWDRDWDVSFWRDRVTHEKKSRLSSKALLQQEMANMEETLQESKKMQKKELDSLKSRVYLADTSLLPRQDDIKPLSEQSTAKTSSVHTENKIPVVCSKMAEEAPKPEKSLEVSNVGGTDRLQAFKTDKQKWALEVLARKTGKSEKNSRTKGSLLEELPDNMRPVLEYDRRSKVPTATRQIQLDRFIEQYLQDAQIESVRDDSKCQAALTAALNKEKEIYERSNSKAVYVNLCVQALASLPKLAALRVEETLQDGAVAESLSLSAMQASDNEERAVVIANNEEGDVVMAWKAAGLISGSPPDSPVCNGQDGPKTTFDQMDSVSCFMSKGPDNVGDSYLASACNSNEIPLNLKSRNTETGNVELCSNELAIVRGEETCMQCMPFNDANKDAAEAPDDGKQGVQMVMMEKQIQEADCDQIQHQEADFGQVGSDQEGKLGETHPCETTDIDILTQEKSSAVIHASVDRNEDTSPTPERIEKISKKVEKYVKEHIRPLHRSKIITTEQYKWAVTKTTNKVMQHHLQAKSADFLIAEGERVRRLAEQYLKIYSEHIFPGVH